MPQALRLPSCAAALATPAGEGPVGAVIVIHEWWGMNAQILDFADQLAAEGYLALAIDLYEGEVTSSSDEAWTLSNRMQTADALVRVAEARDLLRAHPRCNGRIGVTGFCLGGGISLASACQVQGLAAAAPFYGMPLPRFATWDKVTAAIQGHYGDRDPIIANERVDGLRASLAQAGVRAEIHSYHAGHAFMREGDPRSYVPEAATLARSRLMAFFREHLS